MDTFHIIPDLRQLQAKHPSFSEDFFTQILMLDPQKDTAAIKAFYKAYYPIYVETKKVNAKEIAKPALEASFKRLHFYFPKYALGTKITLFVGPLEAYGNIVTREGVAIGLQMYLGAHSNWYYSGHFQTIYPTYLSRRFSPEYIAVNTIQNMISDMAPNPSKGENLLYQMVEEGKRQYIINACFPTTTDSVRTGFSQIFLDHLKEEEANIWAYLLKQNLLFSKDPNMIRSFMQESPYSDLFGEALPGNTGKYIGLQIVSAWMQKKENHATSFEQLLHTPAQLIFESSAYQP